MKLIKCKRCTAENVYWIQDIRGKWRLNDASTDREHVCDDSMLKPIKCKYCAAEDLHWAEEINPVTQVKKMVLTESYGLPHACDERIAIKNKEKQDKKDKYESEKTRINSQPEGPCVPCKGTGYVQSSNFGVCPNCLGMRKFNTRTRDWILTSIRNQIWPQYRKGWR